jgi:hypothetical protein
MRFEFYSHSMLDLMGYVDLSNHKLEVYRYNYNALKPFYKTTRVNEADYETNQLRIAYATARTLCSYHLDKKELYFDIIASLLSHLNFVTKNTNSYLQIYESRYKRLRDFSKTTRIGELAQGVNALFVQDRLNYPYVIDFHYFHEKVYGTPYGVGSTPDFVVLNNDLRKVGLFESKGEGAVTSTITGINGKLNDALTQLEVITNPCAEELIPICARFEQNNDDEKNSSIHYSIITRTCVQPTPPLRILRMHYASWFYLIGDFTRATQLLEEKGFDNLENDTRYIAGIDDQEKEVYWVRQFLPLNLEDEKGQTTFGISLRNLFYRSNFRIGIYKSVINILLNDNLNDGNLLENGIIYPKDNNEEYQRFSDGTLIRLSRRRKVEQ